MKDFNEIEQKIINYLTFMPSPVSIDALVDLSGGSAVNILNAMEGLKNKRLINEKKATGKGVYFFDDRIKNYLSGSIQTKERKEITKKLIQYFLYSLDEGNEKIFIMADLYLKLGDTAEGLSFLKTAGDILYRSGDREKALTYYENILAYFKDREPVHEDVQAYLETVLGYMSITSDSRPVENQVSLLTKAEKIARDHEQRDLLALIKFHLAREFIVSGRFGEASRVMNHFLDLARKLDNQKVLRMAALAESESLYFKGRIREATECYDNAIGNLEEFGDEEMTLRMSALVGWFYVIAGRIARGMGLINTVREKSHMFGFSKTALFADIMKVHCYLEIRKTNDAEAVLDQVIQKLDNTADNFTFWAVNRCNAFIQYAKENYEEAYLAYNRGNEYIYSLGWPLKINGWCLECLYALESQESFKGKIYIDEEIEKMISADDIYTKGFALRYRAFRNREKGQPQTTILADLQRSEKYLNNAGAEIELARTRIALGDYYHQNRNDKKSQFYFEKAWRFFSNVDKELFPGDLMVIMPQEEKTDFMINRLVEIAESLGTIHETSLFLDKALDVVMDFTLAMRCAFFMFESGEPKIIASRNVDLKFADKEYFKTIREILYDLERKKVEMIFPGSGEGTIIIEKKLKKAGLNSFVCIPAKLGDKTFAYLCLDNRFGDAFFPQDSLPFLRVLCTQIAVGLSNINIYNEMKELKERFESEAVFYRQEMGGIGKPFEDIIGKSEETRKILEQIRQVAPMDSSVLLLGETGVGKELMAKAIHNFSTRKDGPFISVNLSILPNDLVASELFGHEKGAFTGAGERRRGRFELGDGGTIFLDEIGDLPANIQVKLLRVLEEGCFERLGGRKQIKSDFRVLAATNKNLLQEVEKGNFRQDLYFRLNVFPIHIAPLRERKEDIPLLTEHFVDKFGNKINKKIKRISNREIKKLMNYHWPGNIRELRNFIERAIILSDGNNISFPDFKHQLSEHSGNKDEMLLSMSDVERLHITKVLNSTGWKVNGRDGAAEILGLKPSTVFFRMKKLGIKRPRITTSLPENKN